MTRAAAVLAALAALALTRALPDSGVGLYLRLLTATAVVLLPGALVTEALGRRSVSSTLVWSLTALSAALGLTFLLHLSIDWTLAFFAAIGAASLTFSLLRPRARPPRIAGTWIVLGAGLLFGLALWHVAGNVDGDGLFHLARVRKLLAFDELSLDSVNEFADGGLHPGYAFPLWQGFLACIARLAGVDPELVVLHEPSVLVPVAFLVTFEAGAVLFRSSWLGGAVLTANVGLIGLAPGHGGAFVPLALPATASRQLLVPAVLTLVLGYVRDPARAALAGIAAGGLVLTVVHPTYSLFLALVLAGFLLVRAYWSRADARRLALALGAFLVPTGAVVLALLPVVRDTASHSPGATELERALSRYAGQLDVLGDGVYRLAPELFARAGPVAVAALLLVPLAAFAPRRRWSAFVLGGSLAVLLTMLVAPAFELVSDAVSISQSRRAAGFLPFAFAFAGGAAVLAGVLGLLVLPLALVAGIVLQVAYPGDFTVHLDGGTGGPGWAAWIALVGALAAVTLTMAFSSRARGPRGGALALGAALLFVAPLLVDAIGQWSPSDARRPNPLTPGLVEALRELPPGSVVFSDLETSYRIGAVAPLYVAAGPPAHVADTKQNRPYRRREDVQRFFETGDVAIPREYGAGWVVVDRDRFRIRPDLPLVYENGRYVLYRVP